MKDQFTKNNLNQFMVDLIRTYSDSIHEETSSPSPYFMTRLQAKIRERQAATQFWETGIIKAQNWLVAFSLIALLFFVSNIVLAEKQSALTQDSITETLALGDQEWEHFSEDSLPSGEISKNR